MNERNNIMNTSKTRNLYYVMDEKEEMFVKGNLNNYENSYTGEIDLVLSVILITSKR